MLKMTIPTTKRVPVEIVTLQWKNPSKILKRKPCKLCKKHIGDERWGLAWIQQGKKQFSGRLCQKCSEIAEQTNEAEQSLYA